MTAHQRKMSASEAKKGPQGKNKGPQKIDKAAPNVANAFTASIRSNLHYVGLLIIVLVAGYFIASTEIGFGSKKKYSAGTYTPVPDAYGGFGLVIPVRDEREWLGRTLMEFTNRSPENHIGQICVYDDASEDPVSSWLHEDVTEEVMARTIIIRSDKKTGLMDGRVQCSAAVQTKYLLFLDGHTMPMHDDWSTLLLDAVKGHKKRLVVPRIVSIARHTWLPVDRNWDTSQDGIKMIFDWTFEFYWLNGRSNQIPILAGGIFAVDRDYFFESGAYDEGMKEWGGENIEQSLRIWMCGGDIISHPEVSIGHIFDRPAKPNPGNKLVERIWKNHLRTARVWLDDSMDLFLKHHHSARNLLDGFKRNPSHPDGNVDDRLQLKKDQNCKDFSWFLTKFRADFDRLGLLENDFHRLQVVRNGKLKSQCVTMNRGSDRTFRVMSSSLKKCSKNPNGEQQRHGAQPWLAEDEAEIIDQSFLNSMGKRVMRARNQIAKQGEVFRIESHCIRPPNYAGEKMKWQPCTNLQNEAVKVKNNGAIFVDTDRETSIFRQKYEATMPKGDETGNIIFLPVMPETVDGNDDISREYVDEYCFGEKDPCLCIGTNADKDLIWMKCQKDNAQALQFSWQ